MPLGLTQKASFPLESFRSCGSCFAALTINFEIKHSFASFRSNLDSASFRFLFLRSIVYIWMGIAALICDAVVIVCEEAAAGETEGELLFISVSFHQIRAREAKSERKHLRIHLLLPIGGRREVSGPRAERRVKTALGAAAHSPIIRCVFLPGNRLMECSMSFFMSAIYGT